MSEITTEYLNRTRSRARGKRSGQRVVTPATEGQRQLLALTVSLAEIVQACGVQNKGTVSSWRTGAKSPSVEMRAALHKAYGIPTTAWGHRPTAPLLPTSNLTDEEVAKRDHLAALEDQELAREFAELTRDIPDEVAMRHPLYNDVTEAIRAVLAPHPHIHDAVFTAIGGVEEDIEPDGWRPGRRPKPTTPGNPPGVKGTEV